MQTEKTQFKDLFSGHADDYAKYRPAYPQQLYIDLGRIVADHDVAVDCGTGNGQAAVQLAKYFKKVIATDPSKAQIENAERQPNIEYHVARAETLPVASQSADLLTVAQALHWFNHGQFSREVDRVIKPGGIVAAWGYDLARVTPEIDAVVKRLYDDILGPYWSPERRLVDEHYKHINFMWKELPFPDQTMTAEWSLSELEGYLKTWSALQSYIKKQGDLILIENVFTDLRKAWGSSEKRVVQWPLFVRVWRP